VTTEHSRAAITDVPVARLGAAALPDCIALGNDRGWAPEPDKWQLLFEVGEVFGIRDPAGGLAGAVALTRYGPGLAAIGMMLVAARHERQGLGGALMTHALNEVSGAVTCLFATSFGRPLYERLGFRPADRSVRFIGPLAPGPVRGDGLADGPAPAGGNGPAPAGGPVGWDARAVRPATAADEPGIAGLDRAVFGADRRAILARLPHLAERFLVAASPGGGAIRGFAASWVHDGLLLAGPVVADDLGVATALLTGLAAGSARPLRIEVAGRHPGLGQWAAAHGLTARSETTFMTHGGDLPGRPGQIFGPLNVAMG
jgi:GNAT superfamily N-acetyltransferase